MLIIDLSSILKAENHSKHSINELLHNKLIFLNYLWINSSIRIDLLSASSLCTRISQTRRAIQLKPQLTGARQMHKKSWNMDRVPVMSDDVGHGLLALFICGSFELIIHFVETFNGFNWNSVFTIEQTFYIHKKS